jgi:arylsulfatase
MLARHTLDGKPAQGAVIAQGGAFGGWCFYFKDGVPAYTHNWVGLERYVVRASQPVGPGEHTLAVKFAYDGGGAGKGGNVTILCDDKEIGSGRVEKTVPGVFSFDDFLDVGADSGEPVVEDYAERGGVFTGKIANVIIDIAAESFHDAELVVRARAAKQ